MNNCTLRRLLLWLTSSRNTRQLLRLFDVTTSWLVQRCRGMCCYNQNLHGFQFWNTNVAPYTYPRYSFRITRFDILYIRNDEMKIRHRQFLWTISCGELTETLSWILGFDPGLAFFESEAICNTYKLPIYGADEDAKTTNSLRFVWRQWLPSHRSLVVS